MNVDLDTISTDVLVFYTQIHNRIKNIEKKSLLHAVYTSKHHIKTEVALFLLDDEKYISNFEVQEYSYQERCQALASAIKNTRLSTYLAMDEFIAGAKQHLNKKILVEHITPRLDASKLQSTQDLVLRIASDQMFSEKHFEIKRLMRMEEIAFSSFVVSSTEQLRNYCPFLKMNSDLVQEQLQKTLFQKWMSIVKHEDPLAEYKNGQDVFKNNVLCVLFSKMEHKQKNLHMAKISELFEQYAHTVSVHLPLRHQVDNVSSQAVSERRSAKSVLSEPKI